ncbi:MAG: 2-isopropylmalate synthase, partial [Lachnospiraceae bacterium]|nr:2-isopropylmalate synthase [Lachnospiraceae bacterium]
QREQVFKKSKEEIKQIAVEGARLLKQLAEKTEGNIAFEYSPESFPGTEVDYAVDVCNAVLDVWQPTEENKVIINIPTTVECAMPHVFATQVEYIHKNLKYRPAVVLSLHPHNDRGSGISDAELGVLAGADRIEGTLFGNGERTGNVDIVTLAMNLYSHGVDPELDFSDMPKLRSTYEKFTGMHVHERQPYAGDLVFSAFSGSHQDAIAKGMSYRETKNSEMWTVPYLPIDPKDVGRTYEKDVIRINSQSGKGGVSYILKQNFGITVPEKMREELGYLVKQVSDEEHKELSPQWVYEIFKENYVNWHPYFSIKECHFKQVDGIWAEATITQEDRIRKVMANGNGRLDAVCNIIKQYFDVSFELSQYEEHALSRGSSSKAMAYVGITYEGHMYWGVGTDEDIIKASISALVSAVNRMLENRKEEAVQDERYIAMKNYMQANYQTVTLTDMAEEFHLSEPYISKYIKEKSGKTFGEIVTGIKMNKARTLLRNGNQTVEAVSQAAGYQNVEHFTRQFKKIYGMTPVEYRTMND